MTIWRKEMLAVCVVDGTCPVYGIKSPWEKGAILRVSAVASYMSKRNGVHGVGLKFVEYPEFSRLANCAAFRPAVQDNKKADEKFTALIKGKVEA